MPDPSKDFTPIRDDYEFFATHSDEADGDLGGFAERLRAFAPPAGTIRMLDFGCGPGSFTRRFLERTGWHGPRLDLALVEPSAVYRARAVELLQPLTDRPIRAWGELSADSVRSFDVILSNHVLYYVPELEATLGRILSALDANGLFLTALAGRDNPLIGIWYDSFAMIDRPVPYQHAEHVEAALARLGVPFERREVNYTLAFPDTTENRLSILRFLLGDHLASMPGEEVLALFEPFSKDGRVEFRTGNVQYYVQARS